MKTSQLYEQQFKHWVKIAIAIAIALNILIYSCVFFIDASPRVYFAIMFILTPVVNVGLFRYIYKNKYYMDWLVRFGLNAQEYQITLKENILVRLKYFFILISVYQVIQFCAFGLATSGGFVLFWLFIPFYIYGMLLLCIFALAEVCVYSNPTALYIKKENYGKLDVVFLVGICLVVVVYTGLDIESFFVDGFKNLNFPALMIALSLSVGLNVYFLNKKFGSKLLGRGYEINIFQRIISTPMYIILLSVTFNALLYTKMADYSTFEFIKSSSVDISVDNSVSFSHGFAELIKMFSFSLKGFLSFLKLHEVALVIIILVFMCSFIKESKSAILNNIEFYRTKGTPLHRIISSFQMDKKYWFIFLIAVVHLFCFEEISDHPYLSVVVILSCIYWEELILNYQLFSKFYMPFYSIFFLMSFILLSLLMEPFVSVSYLIFLVLMSILYVLPIFSDKQKNFHIVPLILVSLPVAAILMIFYRQYYFALLWLPIWFLISKNLYRKFSYNQVIKQDVLASNSVYKSQSF